VSQPRFLELTLFVSDVDRSAAFWRALGFQVEPCPPTMDVFVGDLTVQLFPSNAKQPTSRVQLGFQVPDLDATTRDLTEAGFPCEPLRYQRIMVNDPDGNTVHLGQLDG
jgi:catechol 2,3-dioxygenase-like lactoylglutathione lyase family enzyme